MRVRRNGKGSKRRPSTVAHGTWSTNYERTFPPKGSK